MSRQLKIDTMDEMEPISTAKAVSATASAANAVAKNSIVQALFLPTAKAYGDHWGKEAKERLTAAADAKRQENVTAHLEAVRAKLGADFQPDPGLTDQWLDGAKEIDPVDEDLSTAWRGVLLAIGSGDLHRQKLLSVLQTLSPEEAHSFMLIASARPDGDGGRSLDHRRRLEDLGLLRRPLDLVFDAQTRQILLMFATAIVTAVMVSLVMPAMFAVAPRAYPFREMSVADTANLTQAGGTTLGVSIAVLGLMRLFLNLSKPRLTALGDALVAVIRRVRPEPDSASDSASAGAAPDKPSKVKSKGEKSKTR